MSRNLATTCCKRCRAPSVYLEEAPRLITEGEADCHLDEYRGMKVANATCPRCQARYLAWVCNPPHFGGWINTGGGGYFDLSYRSTFNDESGLDDLPKPDVLVEMDELLDRAIALTILTTGTLARARNLLAECLGWVE